MKVFKTWAAAALICLSTSAWAQAITYDSATGIVSIPSVQVGSATYINVTLKLTSGSPLTFALQGATLQVPAGPAVATYDIATGILTLPTVYVGTQIYIDVTLQNTGNFNLVVTAATPLPQTGAASVCFDPAFLATGTTTDRTYQTRDSGGTVNPVGYRARSTVNGPQPFNGQTAIEVNSTTAAPPTASPNSQTWSYFQIQNLDVLNLGTTMVQTFNGDTMTTTTTYTPPLVFRYSLNAGQSVSTGSTATTTVTHSNGTPPSTDNYAFTQTYTFLGREDLTVPAGTFSQACKWTYTYVQGTYQSALTYWFTRNGVMLKSSGTPDPNSVGGVTELVSGTFNGGPVGP